MKGMNLLKIAWKALMRNRTRAFLTMLGIIIGVASVIAMLAIGEGSKLSIKSQISSMGSNMLSIQPGSDFRGGVRQGNSASQTLTLEDMNALAGQSQYISHLSPVVSSNGQSIYGANNWPTNVYGVSPDYLHIRKLVLVDGAVFSERDVHTAAKVAIVGQTVIDNLFPDGTPEGGIIGQTIRFGKIPLKVIGILEEKGENTFGQDQDDIILAPYTTVQKRLLAISHLQSIVASAQSEEVAEAAVTEAEAILRQSHELKADDEEDFHVRSQQELISMFSSTSEMMTLLLVAIASISLIVGGIGIMNIMYVSVTERTREIGLRMAVGGQEGDILTQFLIESILISVTGGVIGVALGVGSTLTLSAYLNWPIAITSSSIVLSFLVCVITGVFFGWYPARKAAALDPIVALRFEG